MKRLRLITHVALPLTAWSVTVHAQAPVARTSAGRDCVMCHLEWAAAFEKPDAIVLIDRPAQPQAAEEATCLGCHDGSVGDSRKRVWIEHGHKTGVAAPKDMNVPAVLPLTDGKLACRTCHTAHSGPAPDSPMMIFFTRVPNDASQLCQMCHPAMTKGTELGTHPVGGMPWPVPDAIVAAGGRVTPDRQRLICETCHTPHGSREEHLLVMGTQSSELCLTCHAKLRPGMWRPDAALEHPQNPPLSSPAQRQAIRDMGTRMGPGDTLICLSCHKLHHGLEGRYMLADSLAQSNLCVRCHPERKEMFGTKHDLRTSAPDERNRLGVRPADSGPCGACHSFHQFARRPDPQPLDPTGLCATCHHPDGCAGKATGLPFSHPSDLDWGDPAVLPSSGDLTLYPRVDHRAKKTIACLTCHDPHRAPEPHFLRHEPDQVCAQCHRDYPVPLTGPHDFAPRADKKNARGRTAAETGRCGFCHATHNAVGMLMWAATPNAPNGPDALCTECHRAGGLAAAKTGAPLLHPAGPQTAARVRASASHLPLYGVDGRKHENGGIACGTCHDPHAGPDATGDLLRLTRGTASNTLCMECHRDTRWIDVSLHNSRSLGNYPGGPWSCGPCHSTHGRRGTTTTTSPWVGPLGENHWPPDVRRCMGCHGDRGTATRITPTPHPDVYMRNVTPPDSAGYLPLLGPDGDVREEGRIACLTCHVPHGRAPGEALPAVDPARLTRTQLAALRYMVRPYVAPNLCTTCHGFDGIRRYLYYHQPDKRKSTTEVGQ